MKRRIALKQIVVTVAATFCLFAVVGCACAQTTQTTQTMEDRYYSLLDEAERQYLNADMVGLADTLQGISQLRVLEVPTYETHFFEAAIQAQDGRRGQAAEMLVTFRDMLRIDSGVAHCSRTRNNIEYHGRERSSPVAYQRMCAEAFADYYENPTVATLRRVARYWSLVDDLRTRLE